jgi:hypothetical protein
MSEDDDLQIALEQLKAKVDYLKHHFTDRSSLCRAKEQISSLRIRCIYSPIDRADFAAILVRLDLTVRTIALYQLVGLVIPGVNWRSFNAEFLFCLFLDKNTCESLVGDLEERHKLIRKKCGRPRANLSYWTQAFRSLGPIAWQWARRVGMKPLAALVAWAAAKRILRHDSWLAAVVEMWKRIRS